MIKKSADYYAYSEKMGLCIKELITVYMGRATDWIKSANYYVLKEKKRLSKKNTDYFVYREN